MREALNLIMLLGIINPACVCGLISFSTGSRKIPRTYTEKQKDHFVTCYHSIWFL